MGMVRYGMRDMVCGSGRTNQATKTSPSNQAVEYFHVMILLRNEHTRMT